MRLLIAVPSKKRAETFEKYTKKLLVDINYDSALFLEAEDYDQYDYHTKVQLPESNKGISYSLSYIKQYAEENGYDAIFKIDDDLRKFGNVFEDMPAILEQLEKYPKLSAVTFPYSFEFYAKSKNLFTHINKRVQTCYIIKTDRFRPQIGINTFEDFWQFFQIINNDEFTLFCAKHMIDCKPVGSGEGGHQCFDRKEQAIKELEVFKKIDPTIDIIVKPDRSWYYEPKLTHAKYKSKKI